MPFTSTYSKRTPSEHFSLTQKNCGAAGLRGYAEIHPNQVIVIDEIQKIPALLDEVQRLIERDKNLRFVLTGSSARKLRGTGVNLLGGRARRLELNPITTQEFKSTQPHNTSLKWTLPYKILEKNLHCARSR